MGHMELVPEEDLVKQDSQVCYLSHHAVIKESSTTTQLRVVYDASAKTSSGYSLNDVLMTGPKLQDDLFVILVRFRMFVYAFTADICKMFRQVWIASKHKDFQRIVWRESPEQPIKDYRLLTVTLGTSSAPYLAKRCLQNLAEDGAEKFPMASVIAGRDYYMDDLMSGHFELKHALDLQQEIIKLMDGACMPLRKWSSNTTELLQKLEPSLRETQLPLDIDADDSVKTLGLQWIPATDNFCFKVNLPPQRSLITKRTLSSDSAKIFDPLGMVSPVTIVSKMILQSVWSLGIDWVESVPEAIQYEWQEYRNGLPCLEALRLERCVKPNRCSSYDLVGFCDASEKAMGAVVYVRSKLPKGDVCIRLVAGKTKLAPLKQLSLPRLELNGAVMLVKLIEAISGSFLSKPENIYAFTDSTVVLAWLSKHPKRWNTFVANRVAIIQESLPYESWHHVSGIENPADCASRGLKPADLLQHDLWWYGPQWLKDVDAKFITTDATNFSMYKTDLEVRENVTVHHVMNDLSMLQNYSSLWKLTRVTAYIFRFMGNCRAKKLLKEKVKCFLTSNELQSAFIYWVRRVQEDSFTHEIQDLRTKEAVSVKSRLRKLNPLIDPVGLLRVGGRLRHAKLSEGRKNPILLPKNNTLTYLIIQQEHVNQLHGGTQLVLATIQRRFWIVNGRDAVRRQIRRCVLCSRFRAESASQMMSDLPSVRVNPQRPFSKAGIDYTGPFLLRKSRGKGNKNYKGYISLFICMVARAVHLEVVSSLSSQDFISALKRFIALRGQPSDLYSDCGRNFVGADKELKQQWKSVNFTNEIGTFMGMKQIKWHFNPPASPHFGGLWEAGMKSLKHHLTRAMGSCVFTYEVMQTIVCQIEACLNSRPLTQLTSDPNDYFTLTPGHFLIGDAMTALPEQNHSCEPESVLTRWKMMQRVVQHFWKRWSCEYLSNLQQRPKWLSTRPTLQTGDLVLVKDERFPPLKWKMARIVEAHPGADGLSRVFTIRTADGIFKRPLTKLCPLPIDPTS